MSTITTPRREFWQGAKDISPILPGILPFGLISGVTTVSVGLTIGQALGMSFIVFAGASQLAALELLQNGAFLGIIFLTVGIINARMIMYSAALAPHFTRFSLPWRLLLPYTMVDQVFLLSSLRYTQEPEMMHKRWYYLGLSVPIFCAWHSAVIFGVLVGTQIPPSWGLDFTIPLVFLAMIFPAVSDRPTAISAVVGGVAAVLLRGLPFNLGFILAALIGVGFGALAESLGSERPRSMQREGENE